MPAATTDAVAPSIPAVEAPTASDDDGIHNEKDGQLPSLIIPMKASPDQFIEIFPEELSDTPVATLLPVFRDEQASVPVWLDAALLYMQQSQQKQAQDALTLLQEACETHLTGTSSSSSDASITKAQQTQLLASTGIAHLATLQQSRQRPSTSTGIQQQDWKEEMRQQADQKFTQAGKVDTFFPMTWVGRGMLNIWMSKYDTAKFFFATTIKQCGPVLPAVLGMAAVLFDTGEYHGAQREYEQAIRIYPNSCGAAARVGFGLCCYKLGQVDRAKAAFQRALDLDPENVNAMVGSSVLEMAALDSTSKDYNVRTEKAIKMMSMANLLDHTNAMVQNHLANHYFWKWTPVTGTVSIETGSTLVKASQAVPMEPGERIRIGTKFESTVVEDAALDEDEDDRRFRIKDAWKEASISGVNLYKKDMDRVIALAKGAYNSTAVKEIQAESLFFLARVYHVREDVETAFKFYEKACMLAPQLSPARFGLAQALVAKGDHTRAMEELQTLLTKSGLATDALALLGLLEVKSGKKVEEGLGQLRKAIELDRFNPDLHVLEALALQQQPSTYPKALLRYKEAIELLKRKGDKVPYQVYANSGVLCHETRKYDEALEMYVLALEAVDCTETLRVATLDNEGVPEGQIRREENYMFWGFVDAGVLVEPVSGSLHTRLHTVRVSGVGQIEASDFVFKVGDHIRIGDDFTTEVKKVEVTADGVFIELKDPFEATDSSALPAFIKRENRILNAPEATTIAFNIARLYEAKGHVVAAIELHKAILKRNPAYVNSSLRLACIAVDSGSLEEGGAWLRIAATTAPGNPEVHTLLGNLHLSLCDWKPAQDIFASLLGNKVPNVETYCLLSMGTLYFSNISTPGKYAKNLEYASTFFKNILRKDPLNSYAANGLGSVLAEMGEIFKAKETFTRVREVSGDSIADALLNLGHIYLAQKKHPEALQMYQKYLKRLEDGTTPVTSKSRDEDIIDVLLYVAFAYFDWARHTELFNDTNAAPADGRYRKAMESIELAISRGSNRLVVLRYNLALCKLHAANCVLQKQTRNIPRTVEEVEDALSGLQESLNVVEGILSDKNEKKKVLMSTSKLQNFLSLCRANITSADSHLADEKRRANEAEVELNIRRSEAEVKKKTEELEELNRKEEEKKKQEERDLKAEKAMQKAQEYTVQWKQEQANQEAEKEKRAKRRAGEAAHDMDVEEETPAGHGLFDDSDESEDEAPAADIDNEGSDKKSSDKEPSQKELFDDSDDDDSDEDEGPAGDKSQEKGEKAKSGEDPIGDNNDVEMPDSNDAPTNKDLFGDSDEESDEELLGPDAAGDAEEGQPKKKRRVLEEDDDE